MSDIITVVAVTEKEGANDGRAWKKFSIKDDVGEWYSTFDENMLAHAHEGQKAEITYESKPVGGRIFKNLTSYKPFTGGAGNPPQPFSSNEITRTGNATPTSAGGPDWDKIALGKTRCVLWESVIEGIASSLYANLKGDMTRFIEVATALVAAAERDIFDRPAGDDGVPFLTGQQVAAQTNVSTDDNIPF